MSSFLDNLRKKPEHIRRRFALTASGAITVVIIVVWLTTLGGVTQKEEKVVGETPFQTFKQEVASVFSSTKDILGRFNEIEEEIQVEIIPEEEIPEEESDTRITNITIE